MTLCHFTTEYAARKELLKKDNRYINAKQVVNYIEPGNHIFIGTGCGAPQSLTRELLLASDQLVDVEILQYLKFGENPYSFCHNSVSLNNSVRKLVQTGQYDYTPIILSEIPSLFKTGRFHFDIALIQITPPDEHRYCSFGVSVDIVKPIVECSDIVIAEINPQMPRTLGDSFIRFDDINYFVFNDTPVLEYDYGEPTECQEKIAKHVAKLIEDGSCIQVGMGNIPNAVVKALIDKKDLGIHTEVFSDGIVDLVDAGVVTCVKKNQHTGKIITSLVMGTKKLYNFVDNNPFVDFRPIDYCNDPLVISKNNKQVAINTATSIDLTGQVSINNVGLVGCVDFIRGAARSKGGKPIIVLPSTTKDGKKSRIVPNLNEGSGVVITRRDVHYVVTEYGVVYLHGKPIKERVKSLISIAHPKFRDQLLNAAKKQKYVNSDQQFFHNEQGEIILYPEKYETYYTLNNSNKLFFRPIWTTDKQKMSDLFQSLELSLENELCEGLNEIKHRINQSFVNIDHCNNGVIVVIDSKSNLGDIVGVGCYFLEQSSNTAEIYFIVHNKWRNIGIAQFLLKYLIQIARENGIKGFFGKISPRNYPMIHIIKKIGYRLNFDIDEGMIHFVFKFNQSLRKIGIPSQNY